MIYAPTPSKPQAAIILFNDWKIIQIHSTNKINKGSYLSKIYKFYKIRHITWLNFRKKKFQSS